MARRVRAEDETRRAVEQSLREQDAIAMEVMRAVFARLPYGQPFALSDGSVARLEKCTEPAKCDTEGSPYHGRPQFGVDVVIEGGKLDHVEISAFQTGSGMAIGRLHTRSTARSWADREAVKDIVGRRPPTPGSDHVPPDGKAPRGRRR
jgi:hypothetical protein